MKTKLLLMFLFLTITLQAQTNLVPNGNFENWTSSSQPNNWFRFFNGLVFQSTSAQNGSSSTKMQITSGTFNYINSEFFPVVAGKTYRITMYHKLVTGTFSVIDLRLYHQPGTFKTEITKKTDAVTSSTEWRKIEFDYTPTVSESIEVDIWTTGTLNSEILVDNVSVVDVATIGAAYTLIPDVNFEKQLIALGHDAGTPDGKVLTSNIAAVTSLTVSTSTIADLTGIQDFTSLKTLKCVGNGGNGLLTKLDVSKNLALTNLECYSNKLTVLDVSKNLALIKLDFSSNLLTAIDVTNNKLLNILDCSSNNLDELDVSQNVKLFKLVCRFNKLVTLDVYKNIGLDYLDCEFNKLTSLDISKNPAVVYITCKYNKLSRLNLKNGNNKKFMNNFINFSSNPDLRCIAVDDVIFSNTNWASIKDEFAFYSPYDCTTITKIPDAKFEDKLIELGIDTDGKNGVVLNNSIVSITSLDVSNSGIVELKGIEGFTALTTLNCSGNQLKKIDVSKNTLTATLNCSNNSALICIQVADIAAAEKWNITKDATASLSLDCTIYTLIPDAKFEDKLIAIGIDRDGKNGKVITESIASLTTLDVSNSLITDLTGIQDFVALKNLNCGSNELTKLDLSKNLELVNIKCVYNKLTYLDLSKNTALTSLDYSVNKIDSIELSKNLALEQLKCTNNYIKKIDVSKNLKLTSLDCHGNNLDKLDLSKNVALTFLSCSFNELTTLDLYKNSALSIVTCYTNTLTKLDISKNLALTTLSCFNNALTRLDVSKNVALQKLNCSYNQLVTLDISKNVALKELYSNTNQLSRVNLQNGKNKSITSLNLKDNTALSCIQVDDKIYSDTNWPTNKDAVANYSTDCTYSTIIPDTKFEDKLIALGIDTDGKNGRVLTSKIVTITSLDISNAGIEDLTGIEDFTSLQSLNCSNNKLTKVNINNNPNLESINIASNKIALLNLAYNTELRDIQCNDNLIQTLDLSMLNKLTQILCQNNKLVSLNLKNGNNKLTNGPSIKNFTNNPELSCIQVDDATYSNTNWPFYKDATANYSSDCVYSTLIPDPKFEEKLIALGIDTDGKNGKVLTASIENITSLDVSFSSITDLTGIEEFTSLVVLKCVLNQLTALDVSKNVALVTFDCNNNKITSLDVSKNKALTKFNCFYNNLQFLNLKNSKNYLLTKDNIQLSANKNLNCILVDDVAYSNTNWSTKKDSFASFNSEECKALSLPSNNFAIESKGETCLNTNNGEINITATAAYGYKATINATPYTFTNNNLKVNNLAPGTYKVTITIPGENFEQIFTINIPKGATITGKSSKVAEKIAVEIATGTAPYTIFLNGVEQFETNATSFTVDAKTSGLLEVKTAKACEGIFAKEIATLEGTFSAFPNPTSGAFEIEIPTTNKEVSISIFTLEGKLISNKKYSVGNGKVQLSLDDQPAGIYMTKVELDTPQFIKIIKK